MPVWYISHSPNILSADEKQGLAKSITNIYVSNGLPAFYVQVHFVEDATGSAFIGGEIHPKFAGITIYHLARAFKSDEIKERFHLRVNEVLSPVFEPKGMDWEYFITEASRDLWRINGLVPPTPGSEAEKEWVQVNRAVKY